MIADVVSCCTQYISYDGGNGCLAAYIKGTFSRKYENTSCWIGKKGTTISVQNLTCVGNNKKNDISWYETLL